MSKRPLINEALRLLRLYCGYSQIELANELGISQSTISEIEASRKNVTLDILQKYSEKLEIKMSQLLFFAEEIEDQPIGRRGKLIIAEKVLKILEMIKPHDDQTERT
ncbi:helix-turn-helix transcriptional regulator [Methylobacterium sp. Leaf125]|uniref:helix-turn-helix domain-containing protein n=1 Tax=Methylobacterium sp. Leaf125 TaxID=1736265 RepID=UPI0009E8593A|nr:helix-turn-helix transcriptional regulator [Methylobacterium sp. Leaf125]